MKTIDLRDFLKDEAAVKAFAEEIRRVLAEAGGRLVPIVHEGRTIAYLDPVFRAGGPTA